MGELNKLYQAISNFSEAKERLDRTPRKKFTIAALQNTTTTLRDVAGFGNVSDMLDAEQLCINLEKALYANTPDDEARYDKQIVENMAIRGSLDDILDVKGYQAHFERLKVLGVNPDNLPKGEPFETNCNRQIKYLGSAKNGFSEPEEKDFFAARQENLRAVILICRERQREALMPEAVSSELAGMITEDTGVQEPTINLHPYTKGQWFTGKIIHTDAAHGRCIQQTASRLFTVHRLEKLETVPEQGQDLKITYSKDGAKAKLDPIVQKQSRSLHR
ncbi:KfrB domain-containing protein [Fretibacterium fastidiosum]|uniref:KfrB domain-containing protein n=1 Tax=Fretibacterium fastidiosum TaxID=651822 RepID=A0AB94IX11_9BACT|nr:hypothetical protein [Fretibacterium fastidiosum]CBL28277.1 hypothetical protein SY1_10790 [Fretibacterium fastidiosum]